MKDIVTRRISKSHRRAVAAVLMAVFVCMLATACSGSEVSYGIRIHMPSTGETVTRFSDEEIMPTSGTIRITAEKGAPDAGISLSGVDGAANTETQYISSGQTVKFTVEKGSWYKVRIESAGRAGVSEYDYELTLENVELRISSKTY
ncbi:MAG: hypothetical protein J5626_09215 [Lachnospiraceae bacterium]|nr:hypothetical protein [Lachnospiraceae bacterium]